jgi:hypothetical protein
LGVAPLAQGSMTGFQMTDHPSSMPALSWENSPVSCRSEFIRDSFAV